MHGQGLSLLPFGGDVWSEATGMPRIESTELPGELVNTTVPGSLLLEQKYFKKNKIEHGWPLVSWGQENPNS